MFKLETSKPYYKWADFTKLKPSHVTLIGVQNKTMTFDTLVVVSPADLGNMPAVVGRPAYAAIGVDGFWVYPTPDAPYTATAKFSVDYEI